VEYVPFGEVFIEERNNTWNTPYLFNAKELDEETGLYYYGARYYDPRISLWLSADPLQEKYPNVSTYAYCAQNPVKFVDPDGMEGEPVYYQLPNDPADIDTKIWEKYTPEKHTGHDQYWRNKQNGTILAYDKGTDSHYHLYKDTKLKIRFDAEGVQSGAKLESGVKLSKGQPRFHLKSGAKINLTAISGSLGKGLGVLSLLTIPIEFIKIAKDSPDSMFSTFNPNGKLNRCYGISVPGQISNLYYEITSRDEVGVRINITLFNDFYYDHDSERYRGSGEYMNAVMTKEEGGYRMNSGYY
jgi:RHS repeat-associated protein